jgi:ATP-dependent DNA helicase RecQ
LQYFGDPSQAKCGNCDNCGPLSGKATAIVDHHPSLVETVRMVLSGVARTHGRVGKTLVAKMLTGSESKEVTGLRLDKLSTFGLLRDLKQTETVALLDALINAGLIDQVETQKFRPLVQLSERGADVMRGVAPMTEALGLDASLLKKLQRRVASPASASAVPAKTFEAPVLEPSVIEPVPPQSAVAPPPQPLAGQIHEAPNPATAGNHYWTWKVLSAGFSVDDCRQIRGLNADIILDHALRAAEHGLPVELGWFLTVAEIAAIEEVVGQEPPERIRPLLAKLPKSIRYEHVQLFLRCRMAEVAGRPV